MLKQDEQKQSLSLKSTNITPDGGIVKIPIIAATNPKLISWTRGTNAKFHYMVHAYMVPQEKVTDDVKTDAMDAGHDSKSCSDSNHEHQHKECSHNTKHEHSSSCNHDHHSSSKLDNMKYIMDAISSKSTLTH